MPKTQIINGVRYDYNRAKHLATVEKNILEDLNYTIETLCRKQRTGEFFLYGEGGARTFYAKQASDGNMIAGSYIIPMTPEEAREWAEENLSSDEYKKIFRPLPENTVFFSVRMPLDLSEKITEKALAENKKKSEVLNEIVREYFE